MVKHYDVTTGDILASTLDNLGSLIREPRGCGEQNMINFAPDVFVALYLQHTDQLDSQTSDKVYQHILTGFQNQLKFVSGLL